MADKKYYWLRLHDDFFTSKRIKKLRKLGSDFVIIYLKMQLLSLQNNGMLEFTGIEEDFADEIALDIDEDVDKVQLTISYLQSCGLLETTENNEFFLPYVEKCTGSSKGDEHTKESTRLRVQKYREKQKMLQERYSNVTCNGEIEIDIDIEKDIYNIKDKEKEIIKKKKEKRETYFDDESLNQTFIDFLAMRKQIKKPMGDRAITMAINKLNNLSNGDTELAIAILEQSIFHNWQGLFELKDNFKKGDNNNGNRVTRVSERNDGEVEFDANEWNRLFDENGFLKMSDM